MKLPKDYISNLLKILSQNEIQRLVYGNWEFDNNPYAMFDYNDILNKFIDGSFQEIFHQMDIADIL